MGDDLDVPENSREIALHLRMIQMNITNTAARIEGLERAMGSRINGIESTFNSRIDNIQTSVDNLESSIVERRFKLQDILVASLLLPIIGGIIVSLAPRVL